MLDLDNLPKIPDTFQEYKQMLQNETLTNKIFLLSAPYNNPYQGDRRKVLFVCSAGLLRSPTGASVGSIRGYNTRAAGSNQDYALIPLSVNLIMWADTIVFVNKENYREAMRTFEDLGYSEDIIPKTVILDIPDQYEAFDPKLLKIFHQFFDLAQSCDWQINSLEPLKIEA